MTNIRELMATAALAAFVGIGALAATSTAASAYTVCNRFGDCWHTYHRYEYPATLGVRFYSDDWRYRRHWYHDRWDRYRWHAHHDGRGYWRNGIWITF
ncbi:MAG TPA: hypothetical protein VMU08_13750 [Rhizomicrobium sp.]|nr:hypothetical protein [Rhizomicrobium sp.]